jgi:hypothetical protein
MTPLANRFQLLRDGTAHPTVFHWNGAIPWEKLRAWLAGHRLALPYDFIVFLQSTGGGELFGSETLFGPFSRAAAGDDVLTANEGFRERGLSPDYVVFHRGLCASAIRLSDSRYVTLTAPPFAETGSFVSLHGWYVETLRNRLGPRHGLAALAAP